MGFTFAHRDLLMMQKRRPSPKDDVCAPSTEAT